MKSRKFIATTLKEYLNEQMGSNKEFIGYHDTEYIVPEPYYNGKSAKIINLGVENF